MRQEAPKNKEIWILICVVQPGEFTKMENKTRVGCRYYQRTGKYLRLDEIYFEHIS